MQCDALLTEVHFPPYCIKDGVTVLVCATDKQHWDIVTKLLDAGATNLDATASVSLLITLQAIAI